MTAEATRVTLSLEASEPIQGRIDTEDGAEGRVFFGWLGLAAVLGDPIAPAGVERPAAAGPGGEGDGR